MVEHLYALNVITKGNLYDTLMDTKMRLLYAKMVRETLDLLVVAAKGGEWKADLTLLTSWLTPKLFELILALPFPIFYIISWFFGLFPPAGVISPGQYDLLEGRQSTVTQSLQEVVEVILLFKKYS